MNIAIFGYGFVGKAVEAGFKRPENKISIIDPLIKNATIDAAFGSNQPDIAFICVPTPMGLNGVADISIVESVINDLIKWKFFGLVILKSTVTPSTIQKLEKMHPRFLYNPEFLTEANAINDFINPFMHVFGGKPHDRDYLDAIYRTHSNCIHPPIIHMVTPVEASLIKYGVNSFLAAKVMFMNQWFNLCEAFEADYNSVSLGIGSDPRITTAHMKVPGPDGRRGFGGSCFLKDCSAIINESLLLNSELSILREVWNTNVDIRNSYTDFLDREIQQHVELQKI